MVPNCKHKRWLLFFRTICTLGTAAWRRDEAAERCVALSEEDAGLHSPWCSTWHQHTAEITRRLHLPEVLLLVLRRKGKPVVYLRKSLSITPLFLQWQKVTLLLFSARLHIHEITMRAARGSSTAQARAGGMAQLLLSMDDRNKLLRAQRAKRVQRRVFKTPPPSTDHVDMWRSFDGEDKHQYLVWSAQNNGTVYILVCCFAFKMITF